MATISFSYGNSVNTNHCSRTRDAFPTPLLRGGAGEACGDQLKDVKALKAP
jgi:hypothetical protein